MVLIRDSPQGRRVESAGVFHNSVLSRGAARGAQNDLKQIFEKAK